MYVESLMVIWTTCKWVKVDLESLNSSETQQFVDMFILHCEREGYSCVGVEAIVRVKWDKWDPGEHYLATHKGQIWSHTNGC